MSSSVITPSSEGHMISSGGDVADPCETVDARTNQEERHLAIVPHKAKEEPDSGVHTPQLDQEGDVSARKHKDILQNPDSSMRSNQVGNTSFAIRERVLNDGYNWRKYGQKNVKGNEYIRSYYRCTHPSCQVKKQLDYSSEGKVTDTLYFGHHNHPKPQQDLPLAVGFAVSIVEGKPDYQTSNKPEDGKSSSQLGQQSHQIEPLVNCDIIVPDSVKMKDIDAVHVESTRIRDEADTEDEPDSKRQKKRRSIVEANPVYKHAGDHRAVVQTVSDVDIVNDGFRWRKYGQKMVKGSPHPRSYYRCSNPGCPVKKHVERASHDPRVVLTTYEGTHDHDMPPSRTVTPKAAGSNTSPASHSDKISSKSEECDVKNLSKAGHSISSLETKVVEPENGTSKCAEGIGSGVMSSNAICEDSSNAICEDRPNEDQTEKFGTQSKLNEPQSGCSSKNGDVVGDVASNPGVDSGSSEQLNNKSWESGMGNIVSGNCNDQ